MSWKGGETFDKLVQAFKRYQAVLLVVAAGLFLLLLPTGEGENPPEPSPDVQEDFFDLPAFEEKLSGALSQVEGAGEVRVVLTLKSTGRQVLAQDIQREGERTSTQVVTVGGVSSGQEVVALQTISPQFQGALVVCPGGDDPKVRLQIISAVSALTGLGSDKITICKSK